MKRHRHIGWRASLYLIVIECEEPRRYWRSVFLLLYITTVGLLWARVRPRLPLLDILAVPPVGRASRPSLLDVASSFSFSSSLFLRLSVRDSIVKGRQPSRIRHIWPQTFGKMINKWTWVPDALTLMEHFLDDAGVRNSSGQFGHFFCFGGRFFDDHYP